MVAVSVCPRHAHGVCLVVKWRHGLFVQVAKHPLHHLRRQVGQGLPLQGEVQHTCLQVAALNCLEPQEGVAGLICIPEHRVVIAVPVPAVCEGCAACTDIWMCWRSGEAVSQPAGWLLPTSTAGCRLCMGQCVAGGRADAAQLLPGCWPAMSALSVARLDAEPALPRAMKCSCSRQA